ncbi:E3 ubiquitin-protein ligase ZNRF2 [Papilio machaon]|uniref:E3 ubiquitin-protein ligase ZNRF1 n=1 Tax=Papilio machaon TaxID=76193 RepID=A0A0N1IQG5_PAPMA|nr:E3 ubiquitin-protein ligase ZNRF2 [Papilio machaon]
MRLADEPLSARLFWSPVGIKCPVCSKFVLPDDIECHLVMCLTRPRLSYNEDVLSDAKGECVICLEELCAGDTIARLPCLCIYHKGKFVLPDDIECHLVMCLTRPRLSYNEDVLSDAKGECVICLEELCAGDTIARLPCLCIYHKGCIDQWFEVNRSCPEHPGD